MSIILSSMQNHILDVLKPGLPMTANQIERELRPRGIYAGTATITSQIRKMPYPFRPGVHAIFNRMFSKNFYFYVN